MKRLIIYTLLTVFSFSFIPTETIADSGRNVKRERGDANPVMKMSPRKLSKHSGKLRKQSDLQREKQLKALRQSNAKK